jgi:protein-tyrosine phosphatase
VTVRILTVCLGNICRSPTAEAAIREAAEAAGLDVEVDSAGTAAYHVGQPPDSRQTAAARADRLVLDGRARQLVAADLDRHDLVLAMDHDNLAGIRRLGAGRARVELFRRWDPVVPAGAGEDEVPGVPDPYHGGPEGFVEVVAMCRRTAAALVADLAAGLPGDAAGGA